MRILIDINHPAHVHYFRNFIFRMNDLGHSFFIVNRDSIMINQLLNEYGLAHRVRSSRPKKNSFVNSLVYLFRMIFDVFRYSQGKKIDLYLGFASPACSIVGWLRRKPVILIDDTEHNSTNHSIYLPFCSVVLTPFYFTKKLGAKQISFQAFVEQFYINSDFNPTKILKEKSYCLIRFISYDARHDSEVKGIISYENKLKLVNNLSKKIRVYISYEGDEIDEVLGGFHLDIKPSQMHSVIAGASLFITEGATMGIEAGLMGVNYYYINPLKVGNVTFQAQKFNNAHEIDGNILAENIDEVDFKDRDFDQQELIENSTINPTDFLIWFVVNFPESKDIMLKDSTYQYNFS
ncbi:MAG: DUF354 domain-containing protein [Algoriphagus sp.]|uniref:DUF354 domain-containing protein n=1 Tax=Algoriphagus sp. TaxID=1872435 RepID=UPI002622A37D|nr:DUF354 domain-containing protein [Algoriphagus sp.]MDG1278237.1 DUF354 domain-containing protein [Algoriphagus sp.]